MKIINDLDYPQAYIDAINKEYVPEPYTIRVTELIDSPWIRHLKIKHWEALAVKASAMQSALLGTAWHGLMAKHAQQIPNAVIEQRLEVKINTEPEVTIVGTPDLWIWNGEHSKLYDYKTTRIWSWIDQMHLASWEAQTNVYAWLIHHYRSDSIIDQIEIYCFFTDWSPKYAGQHGMPPQPFMHIPIKVWPTEIQTAYVLERVRLHQNPSPCSPQERWHTPAHWIVYTYDGPSNGIKVLEKSEIEKYGDRIKRIAERPAVDRRCNEHYCPVYKFCKGGK